MLKPGLHMNIQLDPTGAPSTQLPILYPLSGASSAEQVLMMLTELRTQTGGWEDHWKVSGLQRSCR